MDRRAGFGLAVAVPLVGLCAFLTPQLVTVSQFEPITENTRPVVEEGLLAPASSDSTSVSNLPVEEDEGEVDLYGNEVTSAVAKYTFDATGSLYELHSPRTALPKLGSPKS